MDTDTYSNTDVVSVSKSYINVKIDADKEPGQELSNKFGVSGLPNTVIVTPDEEVIGRIVGYLGPKEYVERLGKIETAFAKLQELLEKSRKNPDDLGLIKEIADSYRTLENTAKAKDSYTRVADGVSAKKEVTEADKKLRAQSYAALLDIALKTTSPSDEGALKDLEALIKKTKDGDPDNQYGSYDDAIVAEAAVLLQKKDNEGAIKIAGETYRKFPQCDKADQLLFVMSIAQFNAGKRDDCKKTLKECSEKFPDTEYGKQSRQVLEWLEKQDQKKKEDK